MTAPFDIEIEAEPIEASHLLRARCGRCGGPTLAAPGREHAARCALCWGGSVVVPTGSLPYTVPVGYPLGEDRRPEPGREPFPAPIRTSRDLGSVNEPSAVSRLAQEAARHGWDVRVTRARGCAPHRSTGRPGAVKDSFAVRFRLNEWAAYAVHAGGSWESIMMWGVALPWFPAGSVTDLRQFLADPARPAQWFDAIRERDTLAVERRKLRSACDRGTHALARRIADGIDCVWCDVCSHGWLPGGAPWRKSKKGGEGL